jgi:FkbM family methyltransferase
MTLKDLIRHRLPSAVRIVRRLRWQAHIISDWWYSFVANRPREYDTVYGFKLWAPGFLANQSMVRGQFELEETGLMKSLLKEADVFVDVGANIGFYTFLARSMGKQVVAVEPQPRNLECLRLGVRSNGWDDIEIAAVAVADFEGPALLFGATGPSASLVRNWAGYPGRFNQPVTVTTLDRLLGSRFDRQRLLVKVDIEGAEHKALRGAQLTLAMVPAPTWIVEICLREYHPKGFNADFRRTFDYFWEAGYDAYAIGEGLRQVRSEDVARWVETQSPQPIEIDYLFLHHASAQARVALSGQLKRAMRQDR